MGGCRNHRVRRAHRRRIEKEAPHRRSLDYSKLISRLGKFAAFPGNNIDSQTHALSIVTFDQKLTQQSPSTMSCGQAFKNLHH
jgi:hypothetical protein